MHENTEGKMINCSRCFKGFIHYYTLLWFSSFHLCYRDNSELQLKTQTCIYLFPQENRDGFRQDTHNNPEEMELLVQFELLMRACSLN